MQPFHEPSAGLLSGRLGSNQSRAHGTRVARLLLPLSSLALASSATGQGPILTTLRHDVVGARLRVEPERLFVPTSIPGSFIADVQSASGAPLSTLDALRARTHIEGVLRGPAFPAFEILGLPGEPVYLPPIHLAGIYQIDGIRLVDTETGETVLEAAPSTLEVQVFNEVLVSSVQSRALTHDEIVERGIVIDERSFSVTEFQVQFSVENVRIPISFPVVSPAYRYENEIRPATELEDLRVQAATINAELARSITMPAGLQFPNLELQILGVNLGAGRAIEDRELRLDAPLPAIVVIPGRVGFLNQFFSVQVFVGNAAPLGSGLSVTGVDARIELPPGADQIPAADPLEPGDDPLRLARVMGRAIRRVEAVLNVGPDGAAGTPDDRARLYPGESGRAEFLVEGLQTGLHEMGFELRATLEGLAGGAVELVGRIRGAVNVRNPQFSVVFGHPDRILAGEPYTASVTVLNTGDVTANLVSVSLPPTALAGAELAPSAPSTIALGNIPPGESRTASFSLVARTTGYIRFTNLTGSDGTSGRFVFSHGIDERAAPLGYAVFRFPSEANMLPETFRRAADRVLGQALAASTAARLPAGVRQVPPDIVRQRALALAEAGRHFHLLTLPGPGAFAPSVALEIVMGDLLLEWAGGRRPSLAFDQILRTTDAGAAFRTALVDALGAVGLADWVDESARRWAGRGEPWLWVTADDRQLELTLSRGGLQTAEVVGLLESGVLTSSTGQGRALYLRAPFEDAEAPPRVEARLPAGAPSLSLRLIILGADGQGRIERLTLSGDPAAVNCYELVLGPGVSTALRRPGCEGEPVAITPSSSVLVEEAPRVSRLIQDLSVETTRPIGACGGPLWQGLEGPEDYENYGNVLTALFNKPMSSASVEAPGAFSLADGTPSNGVELAEGGTIAAINLSRGLRLPGPAPELRLSGVTDRRGTALTARPPPIRLSADQGVTVEGRVLRGTGEPVVGVPVTLIMVELVFTGANCVPAEFPISQVFTDAEGRFRFEMVLAGITYRIATTDTTSVDPAIVDIVLRSAPLGVVDEEELLRVLRVEPFDDDIRAAVRRLTASLGRGGFIAGIAGTDRAVFQDKVTLFSPRIGSTVPVVLRFRGRATVAGRVLDARRAPLFDVAVNLFPDADSREQPRGMFSNDFGRFFFPGVPLGQFTVEAARGDGRQAVRSGRLSEVGETAEIELVLPDVRPPRGTMSGVLFDPDGVTPHAAGRVQLSTSVYRRVVTTGLDGAFVFESVPVTLDADLAAVSADGQRGATRRRLRVLADVNVRYDLTFPDSTEIRGRVELSNGVPVRGAQVAGGPVLVTTDAAGEFVLMGVPVGQRTISAGIGPDPAQLIAFARVGSVNVNVGPGTNFVVITLAPKGRIGGQVLDAAGAPVAGVRVAAYPRDSESFYYVGADAQGRFSFSGIPLGPYVLVAPGPSVGDLESLAQDVVDDIATARNSGNLDRLASSIPEFFEAAFASRVPQLSHEGGRGDAEVELVLDGETVQRDIRYFTLGSVSGVVLNHQDVPIGARLRLNGLVRRNSLLTFAPLSLRDSHPGTGRFELSGALRPGPYAVEAASPFYVDRPVVRGITSIAEPNVEGLVVQFSANVSGRLAGIVVADGRRVPGADVAIPGIAPNYVIRTNESGRFDTRLDLQVGPYTIEATGPDGRRGRATALVRSATTTEVIVPLLARTSSLAVVAVQADSQPAARASVVVERSTFPTETFRGPADVAGIFTLRNLYEGRYSILACALAAQANLCGRRTLELLAATATTVEVTLEGSGTVSGRFEEADGDPVGFAQISIGQVGFTTTSSTGTFRLDGVPLGRHEVRGYNPTSGRSAAVTINLLRAGDRVSVRLVEALLGTVRGTVTAASGREPEVGARVTLTAPELTGPLVTTADLAGAYTLEGIPVGAFSVTAQERYVSSASGTFGAVTRSGSIPATGGDVTIDLQLPLRGRLPVEVLSAAGVAVVGADIRVGGVTVQTSSIGRAEITGLTTGRAVVEAQSNLPGRTRSRGATPVDIQPGDNPLVIIRLGGVGSAEVRVERAGAAVSGALVELGMDDGSALQQASDGSGRASFDDVALGPVVAEVRSGIFAGRASSAVLADGQRVSLPVVLSRSSTVVGRLVEGRPAAPSPVAGVRVQVGFTLPGGGGASLSAPTDGGGRFVVAGLPAGELTVVAELGFARARRLVTVAEGATVDVGDLILDEDIPTVLEVRPADGATDVAVDTTVDVRFSEPMNVRTGLAGGILLTRSGDGRTLPGTLAWADVQTLRLTPGSPLEGEAQYFFSVPAGLVGPGLEGAEDVVGRSLDRTQTFGFRTRDARPPALLSLSPADGSEQVSALVPVRAAFDERMDPSSVQIGLHTAWGAAVSGRLSVPLNLGEEVALFVPDAPLSINEAFVATLSAAADRAGNPVPGLPRVHRFATLDTLAPVITEVQPRGVGVVGGTVQTFDVTLAVLEPGVRLEATLDFATIFSTTSGAAIDVPVPNQSSLRLRTRAVDRFGNVSVWREDVFTVLVNQPPRITIGDATVLSGQAFEIEIDVNDEDLASRITARTSGPLTLERMVSNAAELTLSGAIPIAADGSRPLDVTVEAVDRVGLSGTATRSFVVLDGVPPTLTLGAAPTRARAGEAFTWSSTAADAFGLDLFTVSLSGSVTASSGGALAGARQASLRALVQVPASATRGGIVRIEALARDTSGQQTTALAEVEVLDETPPIVLVLPPSGAVGIALLPVIVAEFDEPVRFVDASSFFLRELGAPTAVPGTVIDEGGGIFSLLPTSILSPRATYEVILTDAIEDLQGNPLARVVTTFETEATPFNLANDDAFVVQEGRTVLLDVLANDTGLGSAVLAAVSSTVAQVSGSRLAYAAIGSCRSPRQLRFAYTVADAIRGVSDTATVTVDVVDSLAPATPTAFAVRPAAPDWVELSFVVPAENLGLGDGCAPTAYRLQATRTGGVPEARVLQVSAAPGTTVNVEVGLRWGDVYALELRAEDEGGLTSAPATISIDLRRRVRLMPSFSSFDFGVLSVGQFASATWAVMNEGLVPVEVLVSALSPPFALAPPLVAGSFALPAGGRLDLAVSFSPTSTGSFTNNLLVSGAGTTLSVALSGIGGFSGALIAQDDTFRLEEGTEAVFDVLANDSTTVGRRLVSVAGAGVEITATATAVRYRASRCISGRSTFTYVIQDASGTTASATVAVDVIDTRPPGPPDRLELFPASRDQIVMGFVVAGDNGAAVDCAVTEHRFRYRSTGGVFTEVGLAGGESPGQTVVRVVNVPWGAVVEAELVSLDEAGNTSLVVPGTVDLSSAVDLAVAISVSCLNPVDPTPSTSTGVGVQAVTVPFVACLNPIDPSEPHEPHATPLPVGVERAP